MCNAVNSTRDRRTRKRTRTLRLHISRRYYRPRCRVYFFFPPSLPPTSPPLLPLLYPLPLPLYPPLPLPLPVQRAVDSIHGVNRETWKGLGVKSAREFLANRPHHRRQKLRSTFDLFEENRNARAAEWYHGLLFLSSLRICSIALRKLSWQEERSLWKKKIRSLINSKLISP